MPVIASCGAPGGGVTAWSRASAFHAESLRFNPCCLHLKEQVVGDVKDRLPMILESCCRSEQGPMAGFNIKLLHVLPGL